MILKVKHGKTWEFLSNVEDVISGDEGERGEKLISYLWDEVRYTRDVSEGCYLLNDNGKTIEHLA